MILVYAVGEDDAPGAQVETVACAGLTAFTRQVAGAPDATEPNLRDHDQVVVSLMRETAVLPMRFGTVVADEGELSSLLGPRRDELASLLAHVRGRVEIGLRGVWRNGGGEPAATGRQFLEAKLERRLAARREAQRFHAPLAAQSADSVCRILPRDGTAFSAAYLVDPEQVGNIERHAAALARDSGELDLVISGPWPPYSFSDPGLRSGSPSGGRSSERRSREGTA